jgi:tRNA pseudouridine38-40 synthase
MLYFVYHFLNTDIASPKLYGPRRVFVPKMPSLGLLLENPIFDSYNERMKTVNEKLTPEDKDYRPSLDFAVHADAMTKFKEEHIYSRMRDIEDRGGVFVIPFHY